MPIQRVRIPSAILRRQGIVNGAEYSERAKRTRVMLGRGQRNSQRGCSIPISVGLKAFAPVAQFEFKGSQLLAL